MGYEADFAAELFGVHGGDVDAVDLDGACGRGVEAEHEMADGGFAAAGGADDGDVGALRDFEIEVVEDADGGAGGVAEGDMGELDGSTGGGDGDTDGGGDGGFAILKFEEAGGCSDAFH